MKDLRLILPPSLEILEIESIYPHGSIASLPSDLRVFRSSTCIPPVNNLPPLLKELVLPRSFNQPLNNPSSLTRLQLGHKFNQPVDKVPSSLKYLIFSNSFFNQPVDYLPSSLTHLDFHHSHFNKQVDHLPTSLRRLHLGMMFNQLMHQLPPLIHLSFDRYYMFSQTYSAPPSLPLPPSFWVSWSQGGEGGRQPNILVEVNFETRVIFVSFIHTFRLFPLLLSIATLFPWLLSLSLSSVLFKFLFEIFSFPFFFYLLLIVSILLVYI